MSLKGVGGGFSVVTVVAASIYGYVEVSVGVAALEEEFRGGLLLGVEEWGVGEWKEGN